MKFSYTELHPRMQTTIFFFNKRPLLDISIK
jgi:hypothetical protein